VLFYSSFFYVQECIKKIKGIKKRKKEGEMEEATRAYVTWKRDQELRSMKMPTGKPQRILLSSFFFLRCLHSRMELSGGS
jgi:hypothetical protein